MVKFYESKFQYEYSFPAVTLAYFLRYPNPYSRHVLSTDVIDRYIDPETQRLHTVRLHLKRSKIPGGILRLLPKSVVGSISANGGESFILEKSVVDVREGWMKTENRNLEWTGVLSVIERQEYSRSAARDDLGASSASESKAAIPWAGHGLWTDVRTIVTLHSRLGQAKMRRSRMQKPEDNQEDSSQSVDEEDEAPVKKGLLSSWSTASVQRSIELVGLRRTRSAVSKSTEGMKLVLERLRAGGLVGVVEGMRRDMALPPGPDGPWKRVWPNGISNANHEDQEVDDHDD
ncbi:MAG: hypothetical protein M1823_000988 [Watsoniomyces obsoletus]|nr:MAG: hypothetical protein M1823_000988 [Watsoniomyces obsoletus]